MEGKESFHVSRSEPGIMSVRESYNVEMQKSSIISSSSSAMPMRLVYSADGTAVYKPVTEPSPLYTGGGDGPTTTSITQHGIIMNQGEPVKRKRGRPRKYGPDGSMALAITPISPTTITPSSGSGGEYYSEASPPSSSMKKARGRPPGTGKKHQLAALGLAGAGFTPHVITVNAGEDVSSRIMSFSQHGPRGVCILSAIGAISNVTLRQAATSGGTVTYEGRFEILSLSGSFVLSQTGGQRSRIGGLSVSLAGPDGHVLGGGVAGLLTAASPVQVVVGSFIADGDKESKPKNPSDPSASPKISPVGAAGIGSPPYRGTLSESSGGPWESTQPEHWGLQ